MNVVRCTNGCFFDSDIYKVCPHCGAEISPPAPIEQQQPKAKKKGLFGGHRSKMKSPVVPPYQSDASASSQAHNMMNGQSAGEAFSDSRSTMDIPQQQKQGYSQSEHKKDITLDFWQSDPASSQEKNDDTGSDINAENTSESPKEDKEEKQKSASSNSLFDTVKQASAISEGKTMSYFSSVSERKNKQSETDDIDDRDRFVEPVVGWLVCIKGDHFGESFSVFAGMNSIGRSETNKIVLDKDMSVSRIKHAFITYEPKHRRFYVKPGESSVLTYLNDEYITETKQVNARDIIELGRCSFIFVCVI